MEQRYLADGSQLDSYLLERDTKHILLVCGLSIRHLELDGYFGSLEQRLGIRVTRFSDFTPNPEYSSVKKGVGLFRQLNADMLCVVGGGSAIDVAKCIKAYSGMNGNGEKGDFLRQEIVPNNIRLLAIPTTAGTGSEATKYAVIYYNREKQSISHDSIIPGAVMLDPSLLKTLPEYQRKAGMLDALCHSIESFWSVNSTAYSRNLSREAICLIMEYYRKYLNNEPSGNEGMLRAANIAGKAINITQTTAGHAMCYKITSLFGCAHGHAAILCDRVLYPWMIDNTDKCIDPRGEKYLAHTLDEIGWAMGCNDAKAGAVKLSKMFDSLGLEVPEASEEQYRELGTSVNLVRLRNHPTRLAEGTIDMLYHKILRSNNLLL